MVGLSFASQSTILPAFAAHLGASNMIIGAIPALMTLGWFLPSLPAAHHTRGLGAQASARAPLHSCRARPLPGPGRPRVRDGRARSRLHAHRNAHHAPGVHGHGRGADAGLAGRRGSAPFPSRCVGASSACRAAWRVWGASWGASAPRGFSPTSPRLPATAGAFWRRPLFMGLSWIALALVREPPGASATEALPLQGFLAWSWTS